MRFEEVMADRNIFARAGKKSEAGTAPIGGQSGAHASAVCDENTRTAPELSPLKQTNNQTDKKIVF